MTISQVLHDATAVNEKLHYVWGCIDNKQLLMLLNTGPSNSFMATKVMNSLGLEVRKSLESTVAIANGMAFGIS